MTVGGSRRVAIVQSFNISTTAQPPAAPRNRIAGRAAAIGEAAATIFARCWDAVSLLPTCSCEDTTAAPIRSPLSSWGNDGAAQLEAGVAGRTRRSHSPGEAVAARHARLVAPWRRAAMRLAGRAASCGWPRERLGQLVRSRDVLLGDDEGVKDLEIAEVGGRRGGVRLGSAPAWQPPPPRRFGPETTLTLTVPRCSDIHHLSTKLALLAI
jgi:hypothetical protein